jgi:beta-phosphoglucomutase
MALGMIFDLDGVLFDSHPVHRRAWREFLRGLGRIVSDEELDFILDGAKREEILRHFLGPLTREQTASYVARKESIFRSEEENLRTVDGLEEFLGIVEGAAIPKLVATSASKARANRMLHKHGLADRFTAIITGDDVPSGKSNPAIFLRSAKVLQVEPNEVLVFEDAIPAVRGATSIGMQCIGIAAADPRRSQLHDAGAALVVPDFTKLGLRDVVCLLQ